MEGFFGFPFAGKDECNKCKACACGASACGASACGCKEEKKPWFNWWNKGCDNGCGFDDKCSGNKWGNIFNWFI